MDFLSVHQFLTFGAYSSFIFVDLSRIYRDLVPAVHAPIVRQCSHKMEVSQSAPVDRASEMYTLLDKVMSRNQ